MKKIIALLLAIAVTFSFTACGNSDSGDSGDLPKYKVGVIMYDLSNEWSQNIKDSIESLGEELNVEFEYAFGGPDPEATKTAVQNFGASGCNGVLNLHPGTIMSTLVETCEEYGMYIVTSNDPSSGDANYAEFSKSEYFAGEVWEDDYQTAYEIVEDMIVNGGAKTFALHGFPEGLATQMDKRLEGARDAIEANGATIVTEGLSFDKAGAAENIISQFPDVDAIFSSVETVSTVYQPLVNAGLAGEILLNCYDPADGALEAFQDGTIQYAVEGTCVDSMIALVLLYNAMSGNRMVDADGNAASIKMNYIVIKTAEEYENVQTYVTGDSPAYTYDELKGYITAVSPDASYDDLKTLAESFSLEDVMTRHAQ